MRKYLAVLLAMMALLMAGAGALADGEGVVVQSSCNIVQSGEYYLVYCYAQIHNNSDQIICMEQGMLELHNGEQLLASQLIDALWPRFVNPGEDGYVFDIVAFEPGENGPVLPQVTGLHYDIQYSTVAPEYASRDLGVVAEIMRDAQNNLIVVCELLNDTQTDAFDASVAFGLYTDAGQMIYADGVLLKEIGIPAGGSTLVRFVIDGALTQQWESYGAKVTGVQATAAFRDSDD